MQTSIRPARTGDAQNLAVLATQVWLHTYATEGIRSALSAYVCSEFTTETFQKLIADPAHALLVAEINDHLVGYADLNFGSTCEDVPGVRTELATLYIQEHFAGQGIGSRLMAACAEQAHRRSGSPGFWLSVYHRNERAISFYRKHGYTQRGSFYFEFGGERHMNYVLAKGSA